MDIVQEASNQFAATLKQWRKRRRLSQLDLATHAQVSARHISFLEKGRATPSREMVIKLGAAMDIPSVEVNAGLSAAGFTAAYPKAELNAESVRVLQRAVQTLLANQMPWPAIAFDASWKILQANKAAEQLLKLLGLNVNDNLLHSILMAGDTTSPIVNWPEVAQLMLRRLDIEQLSRPNDEALQNIRQHLSNHPRLKALELPDTEKLNVVVPINLRTDNIELSLISMITQFGAVQEITYSGMHLELFFPADKITEDYFEEKYSTKVLS